MKSRITVDRKFIGNASKEEVLAKIIAMHVKG